MKSHYALTRAKLGPRALRRGFLLSLAAVTATAAIAQAVTYPAPGGNAFASGAEGWSGTTATCTPAVGSMCTETNSFSASQGDPPGSLESRMDVFVNPGGLFTGQAAWRSPTFQATTMGAGSLTYERQLDTMGLQSLQPTTTINTVLVDETSGVSKSLDTDHLGSADSSFGGHTILVRAGTLAVGDRYHLELRSTTTTNAAQAGLTGSVAVRYDNVSLALANAGPGGATGSAGVQFVSPPLSSRAFNRIARKIRWAAEVGNLPGGSVVPRSDCTIIGTPRADHITGSTGNDVICGLGGNDTINGRGGRDIIDGGNGADRLNGGPGADILAGLRGADRLTGGGGADRIGGGAGADFLFGGPGNDRLNGGAGNDRLNGGGGRDVIIGGPGHNRVTRR